MLTVEIDQESMKSGSSGTTDTGGLSTAPRETQVRSPGVANATLEIEAEISEANDTEISNVEFNNEDANKARNEALAGQREVENREERGDERRTDDGRYQGRKGEIMTGGVKPTDEVAAVGEEENQEKTVEEEEEEEEEETMDPSEILDNLSAALQAIEDSGTFATSGHFSSAPNPVLSIDGIGIVGLPLSSRDAEIIIATATQAPFGHGERTVVNTDVRDTWELQPNQLQFLNPAWKDWIEKEVMAKAASDLGIANPTQTVKCELHKLLLYKEGGHFLPHKDTEKAPGMFGTLVVILPSLYTGGTIQLSHASMQKKFDFGGPTSVTNTSYAAWYTNILHSVSPVNSGYRFALSYNMIHKGSSAAPHLPNTRAQADELRWVLRTWDRNIDDPDSPTFVGWILDHEYSEQSLKSRKIEALKGADKLRGLALLDLAKEMGFEFYLAQIEYQKTGTVADADYYGYGDGGDSDSDIEEKLMDDVIDESLTAKHFINCKTGNPLPPDFNPSFNQWNCIPVGYWDEEQPDGKNYEGYTGNEEATLEYWYKRTAVILWPSAIHTKATDDLASGWDRVAFLDRALWAQVDIELGKRLRFGEAIISQLPAWPVTPTYTYPPYRPPGLQGKDERYGDELIEFALEEKRLDLFLKMVEVIQSTDIVKMTEAANVFGTEGVRDVVQRCISNIKGIENQLVAAMQFYRRQPEEQKIIIKRLVDAVSISKEVKPEGLHRLLDLMGPELFQACILPNLKKDYSQTAFWLSFWQHYPVTNDTLPEVVHAHEARIHLTEDGGRFTLSSQTLPLLSKVLGGGYTDLATEIIEKIQAISKPADDESGRLRRQYPVAFMAIIKHILQILWQHNIPVTAEPYASFIRRTFMDRILPTLGPRPRPGDFRLETMRTVGQPPCCPDCSAVDIFLSDPWQQTVSYYLVYPRREHLERKLQCRRHIGVRNDPLPVRMRHKINTVQGTITIGKVGLSATDAIGKWDSVRAQIERSFIEVGDEQTRKVVFGGLFPIIQMGIRNYGMGWGKEMEEAAVLGEQEERQMREQRLRDCAHATPGVIDHRSEAGPSDRNQRTLLSSLGGSNGNITGTRSRPHSLTPPTHHLTPSTTSTFTQATDSGRKRKRPMQVIDLTDD